MTPEAIQNLIERCEKATTGDREIDKALAVSLDGFYTKPHPGWPDDPSFTLYCYIDDEGSPIEPGNAGDMLVPDYTASTDAALALMEKVLPNAQWGKDVEADRPEAEIWYEPKPRQPFREWDVVKASAPTLPLAIILAILRALQSQAAP